VFWRSYERMVYLYFCSSDTFRGLQVTTPQEQLHKISRSGCLELAA
jgi:hypothetical protein